jgi:hypothetical protein
MNSFVRKLAITGGVAAVLLTAGGTTAATTAHAASPTELHCVVKGTASISPGLGATPLPQTFTYTGTASCHGVFAGVVINDGANFLGTISGSGSCTLGSLATCLQAAPPITASLSDGGASLSSAGTYAQTGGNITVATTGTDSGGGSVAVAANALFTPVGTFPPVSSVTFTGSATAHTS